MKFVWDLTNVIGFMAGVDHPAFHRKIRHRGLEKRQMEDALSVGSGFTG
jgi:hypothetical protein